MTGWSSVVFKQNLLRALQNLRTLIRQYSAGTGSDVGGRPGCVLNRNAVPCGLPLLPGRPSHMRMGIALPAPRLLEDAQRATHHRSIPLLPFSALPICCAVAVAATSAECDPDLHPTQGSPEDEAKDEALLWQSLIAEASILRVLADLRSAYDELAGDPLWIFAMEGANGKPATNVVEHQHFNADEAIYELARMTCEEDAVKRSDRTRDVPLAMDPFEALLELAQIGSGSGAAW